MTLIPNDTWAAAYLVQVIEKKIMVFRDVNCDCPVRECRQQNHTNIATVSAASVHKKYKEITTDIRYILCFLVNRTWFFF